MRSRGRSLKSRWSRQSQRIGTRKRSWLPPHIGTHWCSRLPSHGLPCCRYSVLLSGLGSCVRNPVQHRRAILTEFAAWITQSVQGYLKQLARLNLFFGTHAARIEIESEVRQPGAKRLPFSRQALQMFDNAIRCYWISDSLDANLPHWLTAHLILHVRINLVGDQNFARGCLVLKA